MRHNIRVSNEAFHASEKVFYRKEGIDHWQGPATVIGHDGKVVIIKQASHLLRSSPSRLLKTINNNEQDDNNKEPLYDASRTAHEDHMDIIQTDNRHEEREDTNEVNEYEVRRSLRNFNKEKNTEIYTADAVLDVFAVNIPKNEQNTPE